MILSEKIAELRKRSGLSQEQFGDKIGVSRQAVSKWEMAQSVPDISKIMTIAEFFNVPTDFLLKDELDLSFLSEQKIPVASAEKESISLEKVQSYFYAKKASAKYIVGSVFLFFLSPVAGIILSTLGSDKLPLLGVMIQMIFLIPLAILVVLAVKKTSDFKPLFDKDAELAYGVKGAAEEAKKRFDHTHLLGVIIGIVFLLASVIPMMTCGLLLETDGPGLIPGAIIMLLLLAAGISSIVYVSMINGGYKKILKIR
ncbi:MAG: helix-turn-helix transcriptional regulator [Clostridiales bacterium]|nr:helix-turn-helix transcriptional regulator [Clostridiales bacterium]